LFINISDVFLMFRIEPWNNVCLVHPETALAYLEKAHFVHDAQLEAMSFLDKRLKAFL